MDIFCFRRPPRRLLADLLKRERPRNFPENIHVIDPVAQVWRSGQPVMGDRPTVAELGFRSVLNLRNHHSDRRLLRGTGVREYRMRFHLPSEEEMIEALRIVLKAEKPLLIHCWHGSDRTGSVAVGYRVVVNHWSFAEAMREFRTPSYGHHQRLYWALPHVLESYDWKRVAEAVLADSASDGE